MGYGNMRFDADCFCILCLSGTCPLRAASRLSSTSVTCPRVALVPTLSSVVSLPSARMAFTGSDWATWREGTSCFILYFFLAVAVHLFFYTFCHVVCTVRFLCHRALVSLSCLILVAPSFSQSFLNPYERCPVPVSGRARSCGLLVSLGIDRLTLGKRFLYRIPTFRDA